MQYKYNCSKLTRETDIYRDEIMRDLEYGIPPRAKQIINKYYIDAVKNNKRINLLNNLDIVANLPAAIIKLYILRTYGEDSCKIIGRGRMEDDYTYYRDGYCYFSGLGGVRRCRYIMGISLFRSWSSIPKGFIIHHLNGNRIDDRIENLFLAYNQGLHLLIHENFPVDKYFISYNILDISDFSILYCQEILERLMISRFRKRDEKYNIELENHLFQYDDRLQSNCEKNLLNNLGKDIEGSLRRKR